MTKEEFERLSNAEKCRAIVDIINGKIKLDGGTKDESKRKNYRIY
jgi:hypothetical protein